MIRMTKEATCFELRTLGEVVEVLDRFRKPINSNERRNRVGHIPYYGANGQVGTIDEFIFDEDLVLVAEDGGFFEDPHRPISYRISGKSWVNNHAHVLRPLSIIDVDWLNYSICAQDVSHLIKGATLKKLNQADLAKILIPLPPLAEQQRIVARILECVTRVDEIEGLRKVAISDADQLASSLYAAIANAGDWPSKTVGEVVTRSRNGKSIRQDNENANGHVLSLSAVHDVSLDLSARKPVVVSDAFAEQYRINNGDVFVSRSNTRELVGLSSVAMHPPAERLIYPDLLIKLEADESQVLPRYLAYVLRTHDSRRQIRERSVGTSQSMVKISGERLKEVSIPVPPIAIQESLVKRFDELHGLTAQLMCEMKAPEQSRLRESILRKAFAGEL